MAKVSSARPGTRQSNDDASAARTTRSTRSQSREPISPQQSVAAASQASASPMQKKRPGRKAKAKAATELTTVDEDATNEEQLEPQVQAAPITDVVERARRASITSGISGVTVKTTFSQEEIAELDSDIMVGALPSLSTAAEELAKLLVPVDPKLRSVVRKEIRTPGSKHNKLYNLHLTSLNIHKSSFGSTEYIQPSVVLRALLGVQHFRDIPQGLWRPDSLIYKINLAQMLNCALVRVVDNVKTSEEGKGALKNLDVHFAAAIGGPDFKQSAFQFSLALSTQLAIAQLAESMNRPKFNAEEAVMSVFYLPDQDGDLNFKHRNVLHMMNLSKEEASVCDATILHRAHELIDAFQSSPDARAGLAALRTTFSWDAFVDQVIKYYLERKLELDQHIAEIGGTDQIVLGLTNEVQNRADAKAAEAKRQNFTRPGATPRTSFGKAGISAMRKRQKDMAANAAPALPTPAASVVAPIAQMMDPAIVQPGPTLVLEDDGFNRMEDDENPTVPTQMQSTARSTLAQIQATQRQNKAKGKAKSFNERQEGATRVNFEDSQNLTNYQVPNFEQSTQAQAPYYETPRRTAAKRALEQQGDEDDDELEEFEPTQDQGFQTDTRNVTAAADQRRRDAPQQPARATQSHFAAFTSPVASRAYAGDASQGQASATQSPAKRQRKNPGSAIPPPTAPFDPDDPVEIANGQRFQMAKIGARNSTIIARQNKPPQVRTPWTDEEERALIDLIEQNCDGGISYARLKAFDDHRPTGPLLGMRGAEDFRFKVRNMKETFLKARMTLPRNFEYVVLDKKAMDKLRRHGIEPPQQARIRGGPVEIDLQ